MATIPEQLDFFRKLTENRLSLAYALEQPALRGVQKSVVDKYSDQAHFIYELLQNADDAKAKKTKFILSQAGLTFIHNGTINFTVSDASREDLDTRENRLGHVNAITSIANSNKNESSIGKFGVGFKAVFQYTNTPHIYDPNFKFKIERFIVPQLLTEDYPDRNINETVFFFPFDFQDRPAETAFQDILEKLQSLNNPLLFLSNLNEIIWESNEETGKYSKKIRETFSKKIKGQESITYQLLTLNELKNTSHTKKTLWLFTRQIANSYHKYSVGFFLNKNKKLEPTNYPAFCFFPTKENTNLKFIVQAPFLLTDSREGIKAGVDWNKHLVQHLADLSAECLVILKQIGLDNKEYLINDDIISFIPYKPSDFSDLNNRNKISFLPVYNSIKEKFQTESLLPAKNNGYSIKVNSFWASDEDLAELFTDGQISDLMDKPNSKWVFPTLGRKLVLNEKENYLPLKANYIDSIVFDNLDPDKLLRRVDKPFIEKQSFEWLNKFYTYLINKTSYQQILKRKPIFLNTDGKAIPAYDDNNKLTLFLPSKALNDYPVIHEAFLKYPKSIEFFTDFGIENPRLKDEIYNKIIVQYKHDFSLTEIEKFKNHFQKFFTYFQDCPNTQVEDYLKQFSEIKFVLCKSISRKDDMFLSKPGYCYYPSELLTDYFKVKPDTPFVDIEFYKELVGEDKLERIKDFFIKTGVEELPIIYQSELTLTLDEKRKKGLITYYTRYSEVFEKYIDGSNELIKNISTENSILLWKILCLLIKKHGSYSFKDRLKGKHRYFYSSPKVEEFNSWEYYRLIGNAWLQDKNGDFKAPSKILLSDLSNIYEVNTLEGKELISYLGIPNPNANLNMSPEQRLRFELGDKLFKEGLSESDLPEILQLLKQKKDALNGSANPTNGSSESGGESNEEGNERGDNNSVDNWVKDPVSKVKKKLENEIGKGIIPSFQNSSEYWHDDEQEPEENPAIWLALQP